MSYDPYDSAIWRALEDLERVRRVTETLPDAVRQFQKDWDTKQDVIRQFEERQDVIRQFEARQDVIRQLEERQDVIRQLEARQDFIRQLEERQDFLRQLEERDSIRRAAEQGQDLLRQIAHVPEIAVLSNLLYQNRPLINGYIINTFSGAGVASLGSFGGGSFVKDNEELAERYDEVSEALDSEEGEKVPQELRALPTTEAFASAEVLEELAAEPTTEAGEDREERAQERQERRRIRRDIKEEAQQQLRPALEALNPELVKMWDGALQAIAGSNPDKERHFTVSLRELIREVLYRLAPDEEVKRWKPEDLDIYSQGRLTRRARLQFICRSIDQPLYGDFVVIDYKVLLDTIDGFSKGTHVVNAGFTKDQLDALQTRAAQALLFLLRLGNGN